MKCSRCGNPVAPGSAFCGVCGTPVKPAVKKENVLAGTLGACLGVILGMVCIILMSRLGRVAAISGWLMAVCTLTGYQKLGGKLSGKGIAICILLMLGAPYLADRIDWALLLMKEGKMYGITFTQAFAMLPELLRDGGIEMETYVVNLLLIYGFTILGAFSTVRSVIRKK